MYFPVTAFQINGRSYPEALEVQTRRGSFGIGEKIAPSMLTFSSQSSWIACPVSVSNASRETSRLLVRSEDSITAILPSQEKVGPKQMCSLRWSNLEALPSSFT